MTKNLLKITTAFCSIAIFSGLVASAVSKASQPTVENTNVSKAERNAFDGGNTHTYSKMRENKSDTKEIAVFSDSKEYTSTHELNGTKTRTREITVSDEDNKDTLGTYRKYQNPENPSSTRIVKNNIVKGSGDTRLTGTTKNGNEIDTTTTINKSGASITIDENGKQVSTNNGNGTSTVTTSTGKTKNVSKPTKQ